MQSKIVSQSKSAPVVSALAAALLVLTVAFWGHRTGDGSSGSSARIANVDAVLYDGEVEFSADVDLPSRWGRATFAMKELSIRAALVDLLRTKSRYMVATTTARESLRREMLQKVNGIIGSGRATAVWLPRFELL